MTVMLKTIVVFVAFAATTSAFVSQRHEFGVTSFRRRQRAMQMSSTSTTTTGELNDALKKPSKTLAVSLEYVPNTSLNTMDLVTLSMQLRKCKASAIWTANVQAAREFVNEQESARGNFPGPCPIVYCGSNVEAALNAGVTGIVLSSNQLQHVAAIQEKGIDIVWKIDTVEQVSSLVESVGANMFLVDSSNENVDNVLTVIPKGSVVIASVDAMQDDNAELDTGKKLKSLGCTCIY